MNRRDRHAVQSPQGKLRGREGEGGCGCGCGVLHFTLERDSSFHRCKTAATQATPGGLVLEEWPKSLRA